MSLATHRIAVAFAIVSGDAYGVSPKWRYTAALRGVKAAHARERLQLHRFANSGRALCVTAPGILQWSGCGRR